MKFTARNEADAWLALTEAGADLRRSVRSAAGLLGMVRASREAVVSGRRQIRELRGPGPRATQRFLRDIEHALEQVEQKIGDRR